MVAAYHARWWTVTVSHSDRTSHCEKPYTDRRVAQSLGVSCCSTLGLRACAISQRGAARRSVTGYSLERPSVFVGLSCSRDLIFNPYEDFFFLIDYLHGAAIAKTRKFAP
jgi:hypothetical protein